MALAQFGTRFKIGYHHAQLIEYFLDRATNPTFEKLAQHYPEHPRPGAPELHPGADLGRCIINALNIKRGYWRLPRAAQAQAQQTAGISPFGSTPDSASASAGAGVGTASHTVGARRESASGSGTGENSPNTASVPPAPNSAFPAVANTFACAPVDFTQQNQQQQQPASIQAYPPLGSARANERAGGTHSAF